MTTRLQFSRRHLKLAAAAIPIASGVGALHGIAEVACSGIEIGRYLPVACIFYPAAGAACGFGAAAVILLLPLLRPGRRLLCDKPLAVTVAASMVTTYTAAALLEVTFHFLPHSISPETLGAALLAAAGALPGVLVLGRLLPERIAIAISIASGTLLAGSVTIAAISSPGTISSRHPSIADEASPNIVLIVVDTLRADHLSTYGYDRRTSPAIDALAKSGIRFENAYAQAPWTKPSVESFFTSRLPSQLSAANIYAPIPEEVPTIAELLRGAGYETAAVVANPVVNPSWSFHRGFSYFYYGLLDFSRLRLHRYFLWLGLTDFPRYSLRSDHLTAHAQRWLEAFAARELGRFFLYLHYMDPHEPYLSQNRYADAVVPRRTPMLATLPHPLPKLLPFDAWSETSDAERAARIAAYDAAIRQNDEAILELIGVLRRLRLWDDTVVMLLSDHGEEFFEHGGWGHGQSLHQELIKVPLVIRLPGNARAGKIVRRNVMLVDLLPTIATLAGVDVPAGATGLNLLAEDASLGSRTIFSELFQTKGSSRAMISRHWKRILACRGREQVDMVFNVSADPGEANVLAFDEKLFQESDYGVGELLAESGACVAGTAAGGDQLDESMRLQLQALGYAE